MPWYKEGVKVFGVLTDNSLAGLESGELVDGGDKIETGRAGGEG